MAFDFASSTIGTRGFFGTWGYLLKRHLALLTVFVGCIAVVVHILVTSVPSFPGMKLASHESLLDLVRKAKRLGKEAHPASVVTLVGMTISDENDWLNPSHLGFREIRRVSSASGATSPSSFNADLWDDRLAHKDKNGRVVTSKALPTNAWWQPWVMSPGKEYVLNRCCKKPFISIQTLASFCGWRGWRVVPEQGLS